jgi:hypothetical protein
MAVQHAPRLWRTDFQRHGDGNGSELATYVVEKGKPFLVVVD